ncbi:Hypothetical protein POVR2_LOCUS241 [uncultured virus]|nr:Hypothetical protein POVR2_LOCUS241 [uncultured virus]
MQLVIRNEDELVQLVSQLAAGATDTQVFIDHVWDPARAIRMGLWPNPFGPSQDWIADWLEGRSFVSIEFWHDDNRPEDMVSDMKKPRTWTWKTLETWKKEAIDTVVSLPLMLYAPELVYKQSKRPKTDMSLFRSPLSRTIKMSEIRNGTVVIEGRVWNVVPVTRYAAGMSKGLYYNDRPKDTCGTFYYLEPESKTYLAYRTALTAFNKTEAAIALDVYDESGMSVEERMLQHSRGTYPRDLMMTVGETQITYPFRVQDASLDDDDRHYAGVYLDLYAEEDVWDQPLCIAAREAGYDLVILENMVGKYQVVSEVLDTRSREDSFGSLLYVVD